MLRVMTRRKQRHLNSSALSYICAFLCQTSHRMCAPSAPPSNQPSHTPSTGLRRTRWTPVGPGLLPCPSRSQRSMASLFVRGFCEAATRGAHAPTLTTTVSQYNRSPEPQYAWHSLCIKVWWCALGLPAPWSAARAILRERRMPLSCKRLVLVPQHPLTHNPPLLSC